MNWNRFFINRNFRSFFTGNAISLIGSQVSNLALPLTALQILNATTFQIGILTAANYLPLLLIRLPAGAMVDRLNIKPVLLWCDFLRFLLLLAVPAAYFCSSLSIGLLVAIALFNGTLNVIYDIGHHSVLPQIVEPTEIASGNAKLSFAYTSAEFVGPSLGGALINLVSAPVAIFADALSYLGSFLFIYKVTLAERAPVQEAGPGLFEQIKRGLSYLFQHPYLRPLVLSMAIGNFFDLFGMLKALLPVFATRDLALSAGGYGLMISLAGIGGICGPLSNAYLVRRFGLGRLLVAASVLPGLAVLVLPLAHGSMRFLLCTCALAIANFAVSIFNINQLTIRQIATSSEFLGRMNASVRFVIWGTIPAGAIAGGYLGDVFGVRWALVVAGVGSCLAIFPLLFSPVTRMTEHKDASYKS